MGFAAPEGTHFVRLLGGGSVFQVALVHARGRDLVCKRLSAHAIDAHEGRAAMVREARLLAMVDHAALPTLVRVGNDRHGPFFLETFVQGMSLHDLVQGWQDKGGVIPSTLVRHIAMSALATLAEIHALSDDRGALEIVHGDISPDHVLFGPLGDVRFVDLGAARFRGLEPEIDTDDRGTVPYVAPEIVRGEDKPGQTGDVYALCATLLWLATGEPLCDAVGEAAMVAEVATKGVRRELVERIDAFEPCARAAIHAALDPDPRGRPGTARAILDAFDVHRAERDNHSEAR